MTGRFTGRWRPRPITHRSLVHSPFSNANPFKAHVGEKVVIKRLEKLEDFQNAQRDGKAFIPIKEQPPWKRGPTDIDERMKRNYAGIRVALIDQDDEPGFPTHFR